MTKRQNYFEWTLFFYLVSIVIGNLLVFNLGPAGLLITSFVFIPFDFILRCYVHELYRGKRLYLMLGIIVLLGGATTYILNIDAKNIAIASVCGFFSATAMGSFVYQTFIKKAAFLKVNLSDFLALALDSIVFQSIAFGQINPSLILGQLTIKFLGGLTWYYLLIKKGRLIERISSQKPSEVDTLFNEAIMIIIDDWTDNSGHTFEKYTLKLKHRDQYYKIIAYHKPGLHWTINMLETDRYWTTNPKLNGFLLLGDTDTRHIHSGAIKAMCIAEAREIFATLSNSAKPS